MARRDRSGGVGEWKVALSGWILRLEALTVAFWPALALVLAFLGAALVGLFETMPGWLHAAFLAAALLGLGGLFLRGLRRLGPIDRARAVHRLEVVNRLDHRPLASLEDSPAAAGPLERGLWEIHRKRLMDRLRGVRLGAPGPVLAKADPFGLRYGAAFLAVIGLVVAGPEAGPRLMAAVTPALASVEAGPPARLDAWITPPDYTGEAPVFLTAEGQGALGPARAGAVEVPAGSVLAAQISGGSGEAAVTGLGPDAAFEAFGEAGARLEAELGGDAAIGFSRGGVPLGDWTVAVRPDRVPEIALTATPRATPQYALELSYQAVDDYGLESAGAVLRRADPPPGADPEAEIAFDLVLRGTAPRASEMTVYRDLTPHPWAGQEVTLRLFATDALGQRGESAPVTFTLPERLFTHPVARQIIAARKQLVSDPLVERDPVAQRLKQIAANDEAYGGDIAIYLALDAAARRALGAEGPAAFEPVYRLLWETALRLEDGGLSLAQARLREAQQALMEAMARGAEFEELERLMAEVEQAMRETMQAMQEQLRRQMEAMREQGQEMPEFDPETMTAVDMQDLQSMMDRIREMMEAGLMEEAQQLLSQLQQMMENMQSGQMAQMSQEAMEGMQAMDTLQEMIRAQQELMDRSFEQAQREMGMADPQASPGEPQSIRELLEQLMRQRQGGEQNGQGLQPDAQAGQGQDPGRQPGQQPGGEGGERQAEGGQGRDGSGQGVGRTPEQILQEALRRRLGEIMQRFGELTGEVPREFGRAERAMRESGEALGQGQPGQAIDPQGRAIEELQNAARQAAQQLMRQMGQGMGPAMMQEQLGGADSERHDPLGREPGSAQRGLNQSDVDIPDGGDLQRSREIRDELRRRAGERDRPELELDYIDRLLDQFR